MKVDKHYILHYAKLNLTSRAGLDYNQLWLAFHCGKMTRRQEVFDLYEVNGETVNIQYHISPSAMTHNHKNKHTTATVLIELSFFSDLFVHFLSEKIRRHGEIYQYIQYRIGNILRYSV